MSSLLALAVMGVAAGQVLVVDLREMALPARVLAASAQAVLNRDGPRAFLLWDADARRWLDWDERRFGLREQPTGLDGLLAAAAAKARGYVVTDPREPDTELVALTMAGAEDLLIAEPEQEPGLRALGLRCRHDLRGRFTGWSRVRIYRWLFDHYRGRCSRDYLWSCQTQGKVRLDLTRYARAGGVRLRFEDEIRENDGAVGPKLRDLEVLADGKPVVYFRAFTEGEAPYLADAGGSWRDSEGDRAGDMEKCFVYDLPLPAAKATAAVVTLSGRYRVLAAPRGSQEYEEIARAKTLAHYTGLVECSFDLALTQRCLAVSLSAHPVWPEEYALREEIMTWLRPPAALIGWHTERDGEAAYVAQASRHGHYVIATAFPNLSFHRHLRPEPMPRPTLAPPPALDPRKVYLCFVQGDGDSLLFDYNFQAGAWLSESRGRVPYGWELQPALWDFGRDILAYYFENATPADCFVGALTLGYIHPPAMPRPALTRYLRRARGYLEATGFRMCSTCDFGNRPVPRSVAEAYDRELGGVVIGEQDGYWGVEGEDLVLPRLTWLRARLVHGSRWEVAQMAEDIRAIAEREPQRPLFIPAHLPIALGHIDRVRQLSQVLDPERYQVVRPDQMVQLARQWYAEHPQVTVPKRAYVVGDARPTVKVVVANTTAADLKVGFLADGLAREARQAAVPRYSEREARLVFDGVRGEALALRAKCRGRWEEYGLEVVRLPMPEGMGQKARVSEVVAAQGARVSEVVAAQDAEKLMHNAGAPMALAGSRGEKAWASADPEAAGSGRFLVFGAVAQPVLAGRYLVEYRLQLLRPHQGPVAHLDVASGAGRVVHAYRDVSGADLGAGQWRSVVLPVVMRRSVPFIECRVEWVGGALAVDQVCLLWLR